MSLTMAQRLFVTFFRYSLQKALLKWCEIFLYFVASYFYASGMYAVLELNKKLNNNFLEKTTSIKHERTMQSKNKTFFNQFSFG